MPDPDPLDPLARRADDPGTTRRGWARLLDHPGRNPLLIIAILLMAGAVSLLVVTLT